MYYIRQLGILLVIIHCYTAGKLLFPGACKTQSEAHALWFVNSSVDHGDKCG